MTDIKQTEDHAAYLTGALQAFREAKDHAELATALRIWRHSPAYNLLPRYLQLEIKNAGEAARVRVNKLTGA